MSFKLRSRFYYTLPSKLYVRNLFRRAVLDQEDSKYWFNNSRVALRLLLSSVSKRSLRIGVQVYTCHTVFQSIVKAGHTPVFIDITDEFKLDLEDLSNKLDQIDLLIVTHTFGYTEDLLKIKELTKDIPLIEDCAHGFLSKLNNQEVGSFADAAIFSTGLAKFPAIGMGGYCTIHKKDKFPLIEEKLQRIPEARWVNSVFIQLKTIAFSILMKAPIYGLVRSLGKSIDNKVDLGNKFSFNEYKGSKWSLKILKNEQLYFESILLKQQQNALILQENLSAEINTVSTSATSKPNNYIFPVLVANRDAIFDKLMKANIEPGRHFHKSIEWAKEFGYKNGNCPNSERIVKSVLTLPIHPRIDEKTIIKQATIINTYGT